MNMIQKRRSKLLSGLALAFFLCLSLPILAQEVCGNGIDDNGDGLVDCFDPQCAGDNACTDYYFGHEPSACPQIPIPDPAFGLDPIWNTTNNIDTRVKPAVADLDNDGIPEVIASHSGANETFVYDGATGNLEFAINATRGSFSQSAGIADTDGDGFGEIYLVESDTRLHCYEHDGSPKVGFVANAVENSHWSAAFVDFDQDGNAEVYVGDRIYNSITGATLITGPSSSVGAGYQHSFTIAADVLPDGHCLHCAGPELVAGNRVFSVDIATNTITEEAELPSHNDGHTAVADWDGDGLLDVVVAATKWGDPMIYIWNPRTVALLTTHAGGGALAANPLWGNNGPNALDGIANLSLPTIADFDNDGLLELAVTGRNTFVVLDHDMSEFWVKTISDDSRVSQSTAFDFEGDGLMEVVYRAEDTLYIWNGADGSLREARHCGSQTRADGPLVVDVNGDGEANIVCACGTNTLDVSGNIYAFTSSTNNWVETRTLWNQHNYVPAHINDDLSVPQVQQNKALAPKQDVFLVQSPIVDFNGDLLWPEGVDLATSLDSVDSPPDCVVDSVLAHFKVCDASRDTIHEDYLVSIYQGDPTGGGTLIKSLNLASIAANYWMDSCHVFTTNVPNGTYDLFVVANDDGSNPAAAPIVAFAECDYVNNVASQGITCVSVCDNPGVASLSPGGPIQLCGGQQLLTASETGVAPAGGFHYEFLYDNGLGGGFVSVQGPGTTSTWSATSTGDYYVVITDPGDPTNCSSTSITVTLTIDQAPSSAEAGGDQTICETTTSVTLGATAPVVGSGAWSLVSGTGTFGSNTDPGSDVSGLSIGANVFRWTVSNGVCADSTDDVTINVDADPSAADAGINDTICETPGSTALAATAPSVGVGTWSGAATFGTANSESSLVSGLSIGINTLTWTVSNGSCLDKTDQVNVFVDAAPDLSVAGANQTLCETAAVTLAGNTPLVGTGMWSLVTGSGSVDLSNDPGSSVTGITAGATSTFRWTIANGVCPDETSDVTITIDQSPTVAFAGLDASVCVADPINLTGNTVVVGTGGWTTGPLTTGGTIDNTADAGSSVSGMLGGDVMEAIWTVSNGVCPSDDDTVTISAVGIAAPSVTLTVDTAHVCEGATVTFSASALNGGTSPTYEFFNAVTLVSLQGPGALDTYTIPSIATDIDVYVELVSNSSCLGASPGTVLSTDIGVVVDQNPSIANAGTDQLVCTDGTVLAADIPLTGTGEWSVVHGSSAVASLNDPVSALSGLIVASSDTLRWTVSNGLCPTSSDDVVIERSGGLSAPDAGVDDTICENESMSMAATAAALGETGTWSTPGDGGFDNNNDPVTNYNPGAMDIAAGTITLSWTLDNAGLCPDVVDDVTLIIDQLPDVANAGVDFDVCTSTSSLAGNNPSIGIGTWSVTSGTGIAVLVNDPASQVTGLSNGINEFTWTITNGVCPSNSDQIEIFKTGSLTSPLAGNDLSVCEIDSVIALSANAVDPINNETGAWSSTGDGVFSGASDPLGTYTLGSADIGSGTVTLTWTISHPTCPSALDDLVVSIDAHPGVADAGADQLTICGTVATLSGSVPLVGTGNWQIGGGNGVLSNPGNPNSMASSLEGSTVLSWTMTNGLCVSGPDEVELIATVPMLPQVSLLPDKDTICFGDQVIFTVSSAHAGLNPNYEFLVNTGSIQGPGTANSFVLTTLEPGDLVEVVMTPSIACFSGGPDFISDTSVVVYTSPSIEITPLDTAVCMFTSLFATASSGVLSWHETTSGVISGANGASLGVSISGTYYAEVDNSVCPPVQSSLSTVTVDQIPFVEAGEDVILFVGETEVLTGSSNATSGVVWTTNNGEFGNQTSASSSFTGLVGGINYYTLSATSGTCASEDSVRISVREKVKIPNVFSPNGDGVNDVFNVTGIETYDDVTFNVFNRWGNLLYTSQKFYDPWDGKFNGRVLPSATYYYVLKIGLSTEEPQSFSGFIELMK